MDQSDGVLETRPIVVYTSSSLSARYLRLRPYLLKAPATTKAYLYHQCSFAIPDKSHNGQGIYRFVTPSFEQDDESKVETASSEGSERKLRVRKWTQILEISDHSLEKEDRLYSQISNPESLNELRKRKTFRGISINLPKIAALIFHLGVGSQALIQVTQMPDAVKILMARIFAKITESVSDEVFNWAIRDPERAFIRYIHQFRLYARRRNIRDLLASFEIESALKPGTISRIAHELKNEKNPLEIFKICSDRSQEQKGHLKSYNYIKQVCDADISRQRKDKIKEETSGRNQGYISLIQQLYQQGAFLHPDFKSLLIESGNASELLKKATDTLFKLSYVSKQQEISLVHSYMLSGVNCLNDEDLKHTYIKLLLQRGPQYLAKIGVEVPLSRVCYWIESGIKARISSGRPVQNILLDKVAMSSIHAMVQNGLLPHFDFLIAKQIASYLDGSNEATRSEGWKRKFNARYKRFEASQNFEYFSYPIPETNQKEFVELFKSELRSKARYLSYKKKSLYSWLNASQ